MALVLILTIELDSLQIDYVYAYFIIVIFYEKYPPPLSQSISGQQNLIAGGL